MTNSKWLSALLAGTALTVASSAAFADTSMLTMTRNAAGEGVTFSISPTADMPAAASTVTVAGEVRALLTSSKDDAYTDLDAAAVAADDRVNSLGTRARVFVRGETETAVGTVGARFRIQDENGANAIINQYTGYWEFSPGLTLTAGRTDSIASIVQGADWNGTQLFSGAGAGLTNAAFEQINVGFSSGPMSLVVGLEEAATTADLAMAASATFSSGDFSAQLAGKSANVDTAGVANAYAIGGGVGYSSGVVGISVGAVTGRGLAAEYTTFDWSDESAASQLLAVTEADDFTAMSVLGTFAMTETTSVEAWYGTATIENLGAAAIDAKVTGYGAGMFWNPVSQLRLGVGAGSTNYTAATGLADNTTVGVGAWFRF